MKHSLLLLLSGQVQFALGAMLACFSPSGVWPAAVALAGVMCCCTAIILKALNR